MIAFSVETNSESVLSALGNFQDSLADDTQALAAVADDLRQMISEQFASEGAAGGTPWAPLAPSTLRSPRRPRSGILDLTGALRSSLTAASAPGHVEEDEGLQLLFGTDLPYAGFHQTGTRRIPARPMIVFPDERIGRWLEIVSSQITENASLLGSRELGGRKW